MLQVYLEGPYGAPMIDLHGPRYKCFILICSGMGLDLWPRAQAAAARRRGARAAAEERAQHCCSAGADGRRAGLVLGLGPARGGGRDVASRAARTGAEQLASERVVRAYADVLAAPLLHMSSLWGGHRYKCQTRL